MTNPLYRFENGRRISVLVDKKCDWCMNMFLPRTSRNHFCSRACYWEYKKGKPNNIVYTDELRQRFSVTKIGVSNPAYGKPSYFKGKKRQDISGNKHPNWRGGREMAGKYIAVYAPGHPYAHKGKVREHRLVMEKHLGRILRPDEIVHHLNGDHTDNRLENLMVTNRKDHPSMHKTFV